MDKPALTADLFARALVAAAVSWGDDPAHILPIKRGGTHRNGEPGRSRSINAAAVAVANVTGSTVTRCMTILGGHESGPRKMRVRDPETFARAMRAAEAAITGGPLPRFAKFRPPSVGSIAASLRPPVDRPVKVSDAPVTDRIMAQLRDRALSAPTLAYLVDAKEMAVSDALKCLRFEGLVMPGETPEAGERHRVWSVV
jgi:hypothetical protein